MEIKAEPDQHLQIPALPSAPDHIIGSYVELLSSGRPLSEVLAETKRLTPTPCGQLDSGLACTLNAVAGTSRASLNHFKPGRSCDRWDPPGCCGHNSGAREHRACPIDRTSIRNSTCPSANHGSNSYSGPAATARGGSPSPACPACVEGPRTRSCRPPNARRYLHGQR
jgi:hypothetical protein